MARTNVSISREVALAVDNYAATQGWPPQRGRAVERLLRRALFLPPRGPWR